MRVVRPSSAASVERLLAHLEGTDVTYDDVGASLADAKPEGYRHDHYSVPLGVGDDVFRRSVEGLKTWRAHSHLGHRVVPESAPVREGTTVIVALGAPWLSLAVPCRVVRVIDEAQCFGFAYGTLPGHPERGEECFVVRIGAERLVTFHVSAFSRPGTPLVRFLGPVARRMQVNATRGYLRSLRRFVTT